MSCDSGAKIIIVTVLLHEYLTQQGRCHPHIDAGTLALS